MPGAIFQAFGPNNQSLTFTLNGLSNTATQFSTVVVNTGATVFTDVLITASCYIATTPSSDEAVYFYAYGSTDGGLTYTDGVTGTDGRLANGVRNAKMIGVLSMKSPNLSMIGGPWRLSNAFSGVLPERWGVIAQNATGTYLSNANPNANELKYQYIFDQYT